MLHLIARRLLGLLVTLFSAAAIVFVVLDLLPGDPAAVMLGINATPETLAAVRADFGLDRPALSRFVTWIGGLLVGDFGLSYTYRVPVAGLIAERAMVSLPLAFMAIALASLIGVPLGVMAGARANTPADSVIMLFSQIGLAVPNFWFGILLILLFAVTLGVMPAGGFPGWEAGLGQGIAALVLPTLALALPQAAVLARIARSATLEALQEDYVRTARAKGLTHGATLRRHVVRNALVPVVTILGLQFSFLIAGTIVVESVFSLPGLGRLMFQAIAGHDLILVRGLIVLFAGAVIVVNTMVDIIYGFIDPRLRATA